MDLEPISSNLSFPPPRSICVVSTIVLLIISNTLQTNVFQLLASNLNELSAHDVPYKRVLTTHLTSFSLNERKGEHRLPDTFGSFSLPQIKYKAVLKQASGSKLFHPKYLQHFLFILFTFSNIVSITYLPLGRRYMRAEYVPYLKNFITISCVGTPLTVPLYIFNHQRRD